LSGQPTCSTTDHFPQQLPGPAQLAWLGVDPQQAVSPGPGRRCFEGPDSDEVAESSFFSFRVPQAGHCGSSSERTTSTSLLSPQSKHKYSKIGITILLGDFSNCCLDVHKA
jgi:hypothetical protein